MIIGSDGTRRRHRIYKCVAMLLRNGNLPDDGRCAPGVDDRTRVRAAGVCTMQTNASGSDYGSTYCSYSRLLTVAEEATSASKTSGFLESVNAF